MHDWLAVLDDIGNDDPINRTLLLAVLRGALLHLLATGDVDRTTAAVRASPTQRPLASSQRLPASHRADQTTGGVTDRRNLRLLGLLVTGPIAPQGDPLAGRRVGRLLGLRVSVAVPIW